MRLCGSLARRYEVRLSLAPIVEICLQVRLANHNIVLGLELVLWSGWAPNVCLDRHASGLPAAYRRTAVPPFLGRADALQAEQPLSLARMMSSVATASTRRGVKGSTRCLVEPDLHKRVAEQLKADSGIPLCCEFFEIRGWGGRSCRPLLPPHEHPELKFPHPPCTHGE